MKMNNAFVFSLLFFLAGHMLNAQTGQLDPGFGQNGVLSVGDQRGSREAVAAAELPDGKILLCGNYYQLNEAARISMLRLSPTGKVDSSFGVFGELIVEIPNQSIDLEDAALQLDGKLVAVGYAFPKTSNGEYDLFIARFLLNGALDPSFGQGKGYTAINHAYRDQATALSILPNGQILVAGNLSAPGGVQDAVVMKFRADGQLDSDFGQNGIAAFVSPGVEYIGDLHVQPDGKIVLSGYKENFQYLEDDFMAMRLMPNGSLDKSFGTEGIAAVKIQGYQRAWDMVMDADGKIYLSGVAKFAQNDNDFAVLRLKNNGSVDSSFAEKGLAMLGFNKTAFEGVHDIILQSDGKILLTGHTYFAGNTHFALARLLPNGALDATFGTAGKTTNPVGAYSAYSLGAMLLRDGGLLMVGRSDADSDIFGKNNYAAAKYRLGQSTGVDEVSLIQHLALYPNPIREGCHVRYSLAQAQNLSIRLYNTQGVLVAVLMEQQPRAAGEHTEYFAWPSDLPAGIYCLTLGDSAKTIVKAL